MCQGPAVELAACECTALAWAGDAPAVVAEVGARCRCGCVLHLAPAARLLAGSARACPARSFWLLQAEEGLRVQLRVESVRLPCAGQALRARDGDSLGSPLLAAWDGPDAAAETLEDGEGGGVDGGAVQVSGGRHILVELRSADTSARCAGGFLAHAYQVEPLLNQSAAWARAGAGGAAGAWWAGGGGAGAAAGALAAGAALAALSLALHSGRRGAGGGGRAGGGRGAGGAVAGTALCAPHARLPPCRRQGVADRQRRWVPERGKCPPAGAGAEDEEQGTDAEVEADGEGEGDEASVTSAGSAGSQTTVTPESVSASSAPPCGGVGGASSPLRRSRTVSATHVTASQEICAALTSRNQAETSQLTASSTSVSGREESTEDKDRNSAWERDGSASGASSSTSAATLTNGWYSPALSGVSAARIRDNPKHTKESCNRKLLKSDLSLTSHPEMEIDYYDYEVNNAGSVPGSYLGMDPAFLVWIPPIEDGDIIKEIDENKPIKYEEVIPEELRPDPGSNRESPEERPRAGALGRSGDHRTNRSNESIRSIRKVMDRSNIIHPLNFSIGDLQHSPTLNKKNKRKKAESPVSIPMKDLTLNMSPVRVHRRERRHDHDDSSTLKRIHDTSREKDDTLKRSDVIDLKFADETSDSSSDIKFADDSPDSNRLADRYELVA
ncbi:hypothetical protein RR46_11664 [Papilio xuthus]|uniref:Uncharacterized protein n=1 Tax=Papilio xuthus TaxID=66420 RepID=A0A194PR72_PAPXU|nr:hypothetical protein RR46_11664 [Papilio xuthus]